MIAWLGLREAIIPFHRPPRVAGTTKYPLWKMVRFAWTAISSFSALPLRLTLGMGLLTSALGAVYSAYVLYETFVLKTTVRGWSSLVCLQLLFSGVTLTALGVMGDYVARIYEESKARPLYVLTAAVNLAPSAPAPGRAVLVRQERPAEGPDEADPSPEGAGDCGGTTDRGLPPGPPFAEKSGTTGDALSL